MFSIGDRIKLSNHWLTRYPKEDSRRGTVQWFDEKSVTVRWDGTCYNCTYDYRDLTHAND